MRRLLAVLAMAAVAAGCASYSWRSSVPEEMRTVGVPTFRNLSKLTETGPVVTRQVLREFQREGTFRIVSEGAAVEVQGEITAAEAVSSQGNYKSGNRFHGGLMRITARVSVIDKIHGKVIADNRVYVGESAFSAGQDNTTALRDASGRAADELAQRIVDDVLRLNFKTEK